MFEFKFPSPKTDRFNEVVLAQPLPWLPLLPNAATISMLDAPAGNRSFNFWDAHDEMVAGKFFFNDNVPKKDIKGLVLLCHGAPVSTSKYLYCWDSMGATLAANGLIAVALRRLHNTTLVAAETIVRATRHVMNRFQEQWNLTGKPLGIVGQSEGATGALLAGKRIPMEVGEHFGSVRAIVALAPSIGGFSAADVKGCCEGLLVMQGTMDLDQPMGGQSLGRFLETDVAEKYFGWMHGCNHSRYLDKLLDEGLNEDDTDPTIFGELKGNDFQLRISQKTQVLATVNYAGMFLAWRMGAKGLYRAVFTGEKVVGWKQPNLSQATLAELETKLRFLPRAINNIVTMPLGQMPASAHFEGFFDVDNNPIFPPIGPFFASLSFLHKRFADQPETTLGFVVRWDKDKAGAPKIAIACSNPDISKKFSKAIEFDAIQIAEKKGVQSPVRLRVSIKHGFGITPAVDVLVEPTQWLDGTSKGNLQTLTRSMLSTVRIPMSAFGLVVPAHIQSMKEVTITFESAPKTGLIAITGFRAMLL